VYVTVTDLDLLIRFSVVVRKEDTITIGRQQTLKMSAGAHCMKTRSLHAALDCRHDVINTQHYIQYSTLSLLHGNGISPLQGQPRDVPFGLHFTV